MTTSAAALVPSPFRDAVAGLDSVRIRDEIEIAPLPAPPRLAPYSHALAAEISSVRDEEGSGRFILLHDPDGVSVWEGTFRVVVFVTAEIDSELAKDTLLPEVAWSWLTECLTAAGAQHTALGGTITATSSTRFGDIAGPHRTDDLEIRASWTMTDDSAGRHLRAFTDLVAVAAGLPPEGVSSIRSHSPSIARGV